MCKYVAPPVLSVVGVTVLAVGNRGCCWSCAACLVWGHWHRQSLIQALSHPVHRWFQQVPDRVLRTLRDQRGQFVLAERLTAHLSVGSGGPTHQL